MMKYRIYIFFAVALITASSVNAQALDKKSYSKKTNPNSKIGYQIQKIMDEPNQAKLSSSRSLTTSKQESKVQVYVKVESTNFNLIKELENNGLEVEIINSKLNKIQGWVDISRINNLTNLDNVSLVTTPSYGHKRVGSRTTAGDSILLSNLVRAQGFTGQGVKVGIISDGSAGLSIAQALGDLPSNVTQFSSCIVNFFGACSEGTAMAEIIHDIAPDAELAIADGLSTTLGFIQRIEQLANDFNADIIVDDLGFLTEPYFEDGDIADAVNALPDNIVYISAAGNDGTEHYQASFNFSSGFIANIFGGAADLASVTLHNFGSSDESSLGRTLPINVTPNGIGHCVFLQWNDEYTFEGDGPGAVNDYDLYIFSSSNTTDINNLVSFSVSGPDTLEIACFEDPTEATTYHVLVSQFSGRLLNDIEIFFNGNISIDDRSQNVVEDSIYGHPASERAIAVGTINAQEPNNDQISSFSSQGPVQIDFPSREIRQKPEITGIDGVSVTGAGGFPTTFFGTSAAAPHIAGITALLKSANPNATRQEIEAALLDGAVDLGAPGIDNVFGAGRANALNSLSLVPEVSESDDNFDILIFLPAIIEAAKNNN